MVFSSIAFIMYFMPVFFLVYYILPASYKNAWLFLASLGFYYYVSGEIRVIFYL